MLSKASIFLIGGLCLAAQDDLLISARRHLATQQFAEALTTVEQYLLKQPDNPEAWRLKGDVSYLLGNDTAAEQAFLSALRINPQFDEAHYSLGRLYYQQSRYEAAIQQFQKVLALRPASYKAYDNLGLCLEHLGKPDQAIRHFLKAIEMVDKEAPAYDWPYANLANLLLNRAEKPADNKTAFDLAAEAAQRNPNSARNYYLAAKALTRLDQSEKSLRWLRRSIELDPEYPEPHYLLAQQLRKQGKSEEAQAEFARFKLLRDKAPAKQR